MLSRRRSATTYYNPAKLQQDGCAAVARIVKRVTVKLTVQSRAITFPTEAKLVHATTKRLNGLLEGQLK